jgi:hypothetical protein
LQNCPRANVDRRKLEDRSSLLCFRDSLSIARLDKLFFSWRYILEAQELNYHFGLVWGNLEKLAIMSNPVIPESFVNHLFNNHSVFYLCRIEALKRQRYSGSIELLNSIPDITICATEFDQAWHGRVCEHVNNVSHVVSL